MDIKAGPQGQGALAPSDLVTCDYVAKKAAGNTPKFICAITPGDELKVKYGRENGEIYGSVAATRLLWALGFGADHVYPVRVLCRECPADPFVNPKGRPIQILFDPATLERRRPGRTLDSAGESGWEWPELDLLEKDDPGQLRAERDALKLLAVVIQHTDTKAEQQRLVCVGDHAGEDKDAQKKGKDRKSGKDSKGSESCAHPFMYIHDLGQTFGHANLFNRDPIGSVNFEQWSKAPVWMDSKRCIGNLDQSQSGTLDRPLIKEAGRKFLADLLLQLSDEQLRDLFEVARFPQRTAPDVKSATVEQWVDAFKHKRDEVVNNVCLP